MSLLTSCNNSTRSLIFIVVFITICLSSICFLPSSNSSSLSQHSTKTGSNNELIPVSSSSSAVKHSNDHRRFENYLKPKYRHRDDETSTIMNATSKCLTYNERYAECIDIRKRFDVDERRELFLKVAGMNRKPNIREVVLFRLHRRKWLPDDIRDLSENIYNNSESNDDATPLKKQKDMWLHTCSFILESARDGDIERDVVLYTLEGHEDSVPFEFQPLVRSHSEQVLHKLYKWPIYAGGGYQRGDLAAHLFLKLHHQYNFLWLIEYDLRFVGESWGELFSRSRRISRVRKMRKEWFGYQNQPVWKTRRELITKYRMKEQREKGGDSYVYSLKELENKYHILPSSVTASPTTNEYDFSDPKNDAHLIWFYPPLINYGYLKTNCSIDMTQPGCSPSTRQKREPMSQWHFSNRNYFLGEWKNLFLGNKKWFGAFAPGFGFSRTLAEAIDGEAQKYFSGHTNQEVSLAVAAMIYKLKVMPILNGVVNSQFYFTWGNKNETAPYYEGWSSSMKKGKIDVRKMSNRYILFKKEDQRSGFDGRDCLSDFLFHPVKY